MFTVTLWALLEFENMPMGSIVRIMYYNQDEM